MGFQGCCGGLLLMILATSATAAAVWADTSVGSGGGLPFDSTVTLLVPATSESQQTFTSTSPVPPMVTSTPPFPSSPLLTLIPTPVNTMLAGPLSRTVVPTFSPPTISPTPPAGDGGAATFSPPTITPTPPAGDGGAARQLDIGLVAGVSAGGGVVLVAVLCVLVGLCCCCHYRRRRKRSDCYNVRNESIELSRVQKLEMVDKEEQLVSDFFTLVPDATTGTFGVVSNPEVSKNGNNNTETASKDGDLPPLIILNPILSSKRTSFGYDSNTLPAPRKSKVTKTLDTDDVDFDSFGVKSAKSTGNINKEALQSTSDANKVAFSREDMEVGGSDSTGGKSQRVLEKQTSTIYDIPKTSPLVYPRSEIIESGGYVIISKNSASLEALAQAKEQNPSSIYKVPSGVPANAPSSTQHSYTEPAALVHEIPSHYDVPRKLLEKLAEEKKASVDFPKHLAPTTSAASSGGIYDRPRITSSPKKEVAMQPAVLTSPTDGPTKDSTYTSLQGEDSDSENEYVIPPDALFETGPKHKTPQQFGGMAVSVNELLSSNIFAQRSTDVPIMTMQASTTNTVDAAATASVKLSPVPKPRKLKEKTSSTPVAAAANVSSQEVEPEQKPAIPRKQASSSSLKQHTSTSGIINASSLASHSGVTSQDSTPRSGDGGESGGQPAVPPKPRAKPRGVVKQSPPLLRDRPLIKDKPAGISSKPPPAPIKQKPVGRSHS